MITNTKIKNILENFKQSGLELAEDYNHFSIRIKDLDDTSLIAGIMASLTEMGMVLCLTGDLGAGKTTFAQFLIKELGEDAVVSSPTFSIMNNYYGRFEINHFDLYRINSVMELENFGFYDFIYSDAISIVEWANLFTSEMPDDAIWMNFSNRDGDRSLTIGAKYEDISS